MDWHHIILVLLLILLTQCSNHMVRCVITDVRLVGGATSNKGTVEIMEDSGAWETTCGVNLDSNDVIVICRQLGFTGANRAIQDTPYEQNTTPTKGLNCNGEETDLSQCTTLYSLPMGCPDAGGASCHGEDYLGCFVDLVSARILSGDKLIQDQKMTISYCIQFCNKSDTTNYTYAGVENGQECYCGKASDNYTRHGVGSDANCQSSCSGDPNESCGGSAYIAVFTISTVTPTTNTLSTVTPTTNTVSTVTPTTNTVPITSIAYTLSASTSEFSSTNQDVITHDRDTSATSSPSTTSMALQATSALPLTGNNTGLYAGVGGGVAVFFVLVIIIVIIFIMRKRAQERRKDLTSSQRMSLALASTHAGINGLGISNAELEDTSAAGGSQRGLQTSNNAAAPDLTASRGDKTGLLVNLNPRMSMNIYEGMVDEEQGDEMMPNAAVDTAATVQTNNGRLSVVYAMPDKNGNEQRNDYEVIANEMAPYASVDNVSPMRPRTMPNKNDRLSVVYAAPDKNGNGPRNDTPEDFGSLYAMPDKPRGEPDGNDDGTVHGLYAKADESFSGDQYEPDMVENELYTM